MGKRKAEAASAAEAAQTPRVTDAKNKAKTAAAGEDEAASVTKKTAKRARISAGEDETAPVTKKTAKRARVSVGEDEWEPCRTLDDYRLPLYRADCFYKPDFVSNDKANEWHDQLAALDTWYKPTLKVYGKPVVQSRHIAAYATDPRLEVKYSGTVVQMHHEYPSVLKEIQDMVEEATGVSFNHCMLNRYENGSIYIGGHRDNAENRVIASVSVGAPRTFHLDYAPPKKSPPDEKGAEQDKLLRKHKFVLDNGSLVVMQGEMQRFWKHAIPKEPKIKESRISLTFRQLVF